MRNKNRKNVRRVLSVVVVAVFVAAAAMMSVAVAADYKNPMDALSGVTGQTSDQIKSELQAGKTPGQIASDAGKLAEYRQALLDMYKAQLDSSVTAGKLTQAQADNMYSQAKSAIDAWDGSSPLILGGMGGRMSGMGDCKPGGMGDDKLASALAAVTGQTVAQIQQQCTDKNETVGRLAVDLGKLDALKQISSRRTRPTSPRW